MTDQERIERLREQLRQYSRSVMYHRSHAADLRYALFNIIGWIRAGAKTLPEIQQYAEEEYRRRPDIQAIPDDPVTALLADRERLREALGDMAEMIESLWPKVDWGKSFLDADTIQKLNEAPTKAWKALAASALRHADDRDAEIAQLRDALEEAQRIAREAVETMEGLVGRREYDVAAGKAHRKETGNCSACGGKLSCTTTYEDTGYSWYCSMCGDAGGEPYSIPEGLGSQKAMEAREREADTHYSTAYGIKESE